MYEQMQLLPLFQGVSKEQLTSIVEKVPLRFERYRAGDIIFEGGSVIDGVCFVVSGEVRESMPMVGGRIAIVQDFAAPHTMPINNLFGPELTISATLEAIDSVGIMVLNKADFLAVASQNKIILVNALNILSVSAQKHARALDFIAERDPLMRMAKWMYLATSRPAKRIYFDASITDWCQLLQINQDVFWQVVSRLEEGRCVEIISGRLHLVNRYALRHYIAERQGSDIGGR